MGQNTFRIFRLMSYKLFITNKWTFYFFIFVTINVFSSCQQNQAKKLIAKKGELDLSTWNFESDGSVFLEGEWEFYWNRFFLNSDFENCSAAKKIVNIPHSWNNLIINNSKLGSNGFATYRLVVDIPDKYDVLALEILPQLTSYKLFVNNKEVASSGTISKTADNAIACYERKIVVVPADTTRLDFIFYISNFHHYNGGFQHSIQLGLPERLIYEEQIRILINIMLFGCIAIMAIFHLIQYFMYSYTKSPLFFAFFCILILIRMSIAGHHFETFLVSLNWSTVIFLELFSFIAAIPAFFIYIKSVFPKLIHKIVVQAVSLVTLLFSVFLLIAKPQVYLQFVIYLEFWVVVNVIYIIICMIVAVFKKMDNIGVFLIGFLVMGVSVINDVLVRNSLILNDYSIQFGFFVFIFSQSFLLSKRFSQAFEKNKALTNELLSINENLEQIIEARTLEIQQQKEQIEKHVDILKKSYDKLKELENFKEGLTGMIVHDLKNPLNIIVNTIKEQILNTRERGNIEKAALKMNNMVMNILDVQKYEDNKMELQKSDVSIGESIKFAIDEVVQLLIDKNLKIVTNIPKHSYVNADKIIITRVLVNFLTNAIKFSPVNSTITIDVNEREYNKVRIAVTDSGPGLEPQNQTLCFEKYGQYKAVNLNGLKSSGLGLFFCKIAVESHKGRIGVISEYGNGATFWFELEKSNRIKNQIDVQTVSLQKKTIALLSDDYKDLETYILKMKKLELYKAGELRKIIKQIPDKSNKIKQWKQAILKSIITQNEDVFQQLLNNNQ